MNNFIQYINDNAVPLKEAKTQQRELYLNVMEKSIAEYDFSDIENKLDNPIYDFQDIFNGYSRIGMSRLLSVMAFLIKEKRIMDSDAFWHKLMNAVLDDILLDHPKSGVEFLVLEICIALHVMGSGAPYYTSYIEKIRQINPYDKYDSTLAKKTADELHNFCMYGICAEYLRGMLTGEDTGDFIDKHWAVQKNKFNKNGRYMDPGCPMVYDITSGYRIALMLKMGYKGKSAKDMREVLRKNAVNLLMQMSSDYKFPYGGRSNQFNFNECLASSMFEYHSQTFSEEGGHKIAGVFRHYALKSVSGIYSWLNENPPKHIKNHFPISSSYGIDSYGTYERYMVTMGAFMSGALLFMDESIPLYHLQASSPGYLLADMDEFHKVFASNRGYSIEIDPAADPGYDSSGLGRIHYCGAPLELALSMPFAANPAYLLGEFTNSRARSICAFWTFDGKKEYLSESDCHYTTEIISAGAEAFRFKVQYSIDGRGKITEEYLVTGDGVCIYCNCDFADISYCIPVLEYNGRDETNIEIHSRNCCIRLEGWVYSISWKEGTFAEFCDYLLYNRNGAYRELNLLNCSNEISIKLSIEKEQK
jgi:hypothetical protein